MQENEGMGIGPQETRLAPRGSRALAVAIIAICAVTEVSLIVYGDLDLIVRLTAWVAFAAVGAYAVFWAPAVRLTPAEVEVVNPLRTHRMSWPAITAIDTRWSLTLVTATRRVSVWAAPAPGPWSELGRVHRDPLGRARLDPQDRRNLPRSLGALAPVLLLRQWESYRGEGEAGTETARWHVALISALAVLAAVGLVTAAL
jgi:hypothetical protein